MKTDFLDFDYLIEINENRVEQFSTAYQKVLDRITNIILIYSALSIYLVGLVQDLIFDDATRDFVVVACIYFLSFLISIIFLIKLLIPIQVAYLDFPSKYYTTIRLELEAENLTKEEVQKSLQLSYITELEEAIVTNENVFTKKSTFYFYALVFALFAVFPYLYCLKYHLSKKEDKIEKVEIVNFKDSSNLHLN